MYWGNNQYGGDYGGSDKTKPAKDPIHSVTKWIRTRPVAQKAALGALAATLVRSTDSYVKSNQLPPFRLRIRARFSLH